MIDFPQAAPASDPAPLFSAPLFNIDALPSTNYRERYSYILVRGLDSLLVKIESLISQAIRLLITFCIWAEERYLPNDRAVTSRFGHGIQNGGNSCYMNAVIQAVRATPKALRCGTGMSPRRPASSSSDWIYTVHADAVLKLIQIMRPQGRTLKASEINLYREQQVQGDPQESRFRGHAVNFQAGSNKAQADAAEFTQYLLKNLASSSYLLPNVWDRETYKTCSIITPNSYQDNLPLNLGAHSAAPFTELQDLSFTVERQEMDGERLQVRVPVRELAVSHHSPAPVVTFFVERAFRNFMNGESERASTPIIPTKTIEFRVIQKLKIKALYRLKAIVAHSGSDIDKGHYYTYVPHNRGYVEYNDDRVRYFKHPQIDTRSYFSPKTCEQDVQQNGTIYFYEFDKFIEKM